MILVANQKFEVMLVPEKFYYDRMGKLVEDWIIDPIWHAYLNQVPRDTEVSVNDFIVQA